LIPDQNGRLHTESPSLARTALLLLCFLPASLPAWAQEPTVKDYAGRLPENTVVCLTWQNLENLKQLRATNPLLRFVGSPEMKANWQALQEFEQRQRQQKAAAQPDKQTATTGKEVELRELASLLANPGLFALVPNQPSEGTAAPAWVHLYLYDMTGMEETLASLEARSATAREETKTYAFQGVTVEEILGPNAKPSDYRARVGHWLVGGGSRQAVEAWIQAVQEPPQRGLKNTSAYERAEPFRRGEAQLEVFVNPQAASKLIHDLPAATQSTPRPPQLAAALGLDDWELFFLTVSFQPERTRYDFTALHKPSAALAGLLGPSVSDFPSLSFAPSDSYSYSVAELDIAVFWNFFNNLIQEQLPPAQAQMAAGFIGMAEGILGVTLHDLAGAWGSELAQFSFPSPSGEIHTVRVFALQRNDTVLAAVHNLITAFGDKLNFTELPADETEPGVTYFRLLLPEDEQAQTDAGRDQEQPLFAAVTPRWLLVGRSRSEIQQALRRASGGPSLRQSPVFLEARGRFPAELATFSFVDAQTWLASGALAGLVRQMAGAMTEAQQRPEQPGEAEQNPEPQEIPPPPQAPAPAEQGAPNLHRRPSPEPAELPPPEFQLPQGYLKWLLSATTSDARGIYHTGYIE
jgi:hypothetical protein